jgi:hypothetical protein
LPRGVRVGGNLFSKTRCVIHSGKPGAESIKVDCGLACEGVYGFRAVSKTRGLPGSPLPPRIAPILGGREKVARLSREHEKIAELESELESARIEREAAVTKYRSHVVRDHAKAAEA